MKYLFRTLAFVLIPFLAFSQQNKKQEKIEFIFVYDALCGWCYGFSPVIQRIKSEYPDAVFTIYSGGLAIGKRAAPIRGMYEYLKNALPTVEKTADVVFAKPFRDMAEEGSYFYNSEPPAIALSVVKTMRPAIAFEYAHRLHQVIFFEGRSLNDTVTYSALADEFNLNKEEFLQKFSDPAFKTKAYEDFSKAKELKVEGFPTLILKKGNHLNYITTGYQDYNKVKKAIEKSIKSYNG